MNRAFPASLALSRLALIALPLAACLAPVGADQQQVGTDPAGSGPMLKSGFYIDPERSLVIRDTYITDNSTRTLDPCVDRAAHGPGDVGTAQTWTFGYLMKQMANGRDAGVFAHNWLANWKLSTVVNGDPLTPILNADGSGTPLASRIYDAWQRASGGTAGGNVQLAMNRAPFRLLAIVNRFDLRNPKPARFGEGSAGELRFVFSVLDLDHTESTGGCLQSSGTQSGSKPGDNLLILEYAVDRANAAAVQSWISSWVDLTNATSQSAFASALENLTQQVVKAGAGGSRPNGSALIRLRTHESQDGTTWDLREFAINNSGYLFPTTVKQTPPFEKRDDPGLDGWINGHPVEIANDTHTLPTPYLGAHALNIANSFTWRFNYVSDDDLRHNFALRTCNGCHGMEAGNSPNLGSRNAFSHVTGRILGQHSEFSGFLSGMDVDGNSFCPTVPPQNQTYCFNELERRMDDIFSYYSTGQ